MLLLKKWQGFPIAAAIGTHKQSCLLHVLDQASKTTMLIDSGAEVSVRPATNSRKQQHPEGPPLRAANGGYIKTFGTSVATVDIGFNKPFTCKFYHAEVTQAILGADFLRQSGLLVDVANKRLLDPKSFSSVPIYQRSSATFVPLHLTLIQEDCPYAKLWAKFPNLSTPTFHLNSPAHSVKHYITTKGQPPFARPRGLAPDRLMAAKTEFEGLMKMGIIRPSKSNFSSPLYMVPKKRRYLEALWRLQEAE